jgi:adenylate cyclase
MTAGLMLKIAPFVLASRGGEQPMPEMRKLAAILAADVVGFSRLAGTDEDRTLARLRALRSDLIDPTIAVHHGRVVKRTGDGALVEFRSVVDAVRCAVEIQHAMVERNAGVPENRRIEFRIGVHVGDVVEESDGDLMGDGVNIAARLEGIAQPGAICLSEDAYRQERARLDLLVSDLGEKALKNIIHPVRVYALEVGKPAEPKPEVQVQVVAEKAAAPEKPSIAVLPFQNMSGDAEQDYFADGIAEDIITALSKLSQLFVIARNSSFTFKGRNVHVQEIGKTLGVRYVLEGSVRKAGNRVRITAQLIDATNDGHLWAERFDRDLTDIFAVQDDVTGQIVKALSLNLTQGDRQRMRPSRPAIWRRSTASCVAGSSGGATQRSLTPRRASCCSAPPNSTRSSRPDTLGSPRRILTTMSVNGPTRRRDRSNSPMRRRRGPRRSIRNCPRPTGR